MCFTKVDFHDTNSSIAIGSIITAKYGCGYRQVVITMVLKSKH